jgi:CRISPR-associated protein Cas1
MTSTDAARNDTPDLLPARMLNEYTYCPRLFYLEWVQKEFAPSEDTVTGNMVHERADHPRGELRAESGIAASSVALSSENLGLTAVIDVAEGTGGSVRPVDYKKGKAPDVPAGAWEADMVQVCVQALLLRDAGYRCDEAVLYYAGSRTRVTVPVTGELEARTLDLARQAREVAASGRIPLPLVDSPKCPRCSLNAICLPDEVNTLAERTTAPPRRLTPSAGAARPLYVTTQGAVIGTSGGRFEIRLKGEELSSVRVLDVSQICIRGNATVTAQALRKALAAQIPVCWFSYGGWLSGVTTCLPGKNIELRRRQYAAAADGSLAFCRAVVAGKIRNSRTLLRRNSRPGCAAAVAQLAGIADSAGQAPALQVLLGLEGAAARIYFGQFGTMLRDEWGLDGNVLARTRRPPRDPVNCLLSYLYALLAKDLTAVTWSVGFDPYLGLYHQPRFGRPALALDLMEEFRPVVADSVAITLLNTREVTGADFLRRGAGTALADRARQAVLAAYERRLDTEIVHPVFGYRISYRRVLEVQARLLGAYLLGEVPAYVPFTTR